MSNVMSSEPQGTASAPALPPRRRRRLLLVVVAALVVLAGSIAAATIWYRHRQPVPSLQAHRQPDDPRLLYQGPFRNIHPDSAYVGDKVCSTCHADIAASYHRHPMANSLLPMSALADKEILDAAHHNPFESLHKRFTIARRGADITHRVVFADVPDQPPIALDFPVHFVIGSGTHGRSYLSMRNGFLFETPISWFSSKEIWDLSPGFDEKAVTGRPVDVTCLFCHGDRSNLHDGSRARFDEPIFPGQIAIGCERCHGPGGRHADTTDKFDIVNPGTKDNDGRFVLTPKLRDAVCEQCHLEGDQRVVRRGRGFYDYRPGLPLEQFWNVFLATDEQGVPQAVSQVEQMHQSRCYLASRDGPKPLLCVSCHNPHHYVAPPEQERYYRGKCQSCHAVNHPCSEPKSRRLQRQADDSCIACHMPHSATRDIAHTAYTDHRIPRRPLVEKNGPHSPSLTIPRLASFYEERLPSESSDCRRDLGIALTLSLFSYRAGLAPSGQDPIALLESALPGDPQDVLAWAMKGNALSARGRLSEALASFQKTLQLHPDHEGALLGAAMVTRKMGQLDVSLDYWRRVLAVNPEWPGSRDSYTLLLAQAQRWDDVRPQCRLWLERQPNNAEALALWIRCLLKEGNKDEARRQFARLEALKPPNLDALRKEFEKQLR